MISNCPACGAPLNVEGSTTKTICPFCGNSFKVDMAGVQPALQKTESSPEPSELPAYKPPAPPAPQIDTDPLYNPPLESSSRPESAYTPPPAPHIPFPRQTYESARQTAQGMYGTVAAKGKSFLVGALILMLALLGGCCFCLFISIQQIVRWLGGG